jgi:hypothetical protein
MNAKKTSARRGGKRLLLLTPPLLQTNSPYPATMHLTGFLRGLGLAVEQRDLSIKVVRDVLAEYGGDEAEELLELLGGRLDADAKVAASEVVDELALWIRDNVDPGFGFSRYAERLGAAAPFGEVERAVKRRGVMDGPLERHLESAIAQTRPTMIGITCPFPGTLVAAFKIARYVRRRHPRIKLVLGGGFVSTELRDMDDRRASDYFDHIVFDEGYAPMAKLMGLGEVDVPAFVAPDYDGIDWSEYFDVAETENPMHRLWSVGRWRKLVMARGCYWRKCAFCDVRLPYIGCFRMPRAEEIVDAMQKLGGDFHFVDEAMPPALVAGVSREIIKRRLKCRWWGNVRFDSSFTPQLARLMAKAGCVAVTGGLECANDRLLALMNKGITLDSARKALTAFRDAGIMVHAYLMYGFPTETEKEAFGALDFVRTLFKDGLVQSAFWHRFALTVHSPIAAEADRFGITAIHPRNRKGRMFRRNELEFFEPGAPNWDEIGPALELAMHNYIEGRGLNKRPSFWKRIVQRRDGQNG